MLKTGIPWADLPARYGKPNTARKRFDRWSAAGVWCRAAAAPGGPDPEEVQLDATIVKARPVAATGRRKMGGKEEGAGDRRCVGRGRLLRSVVTAGPRGDATQAEALRAGFGRGAVGHVPADAADDCGAIRRRVRRTGAKACIRPNPTREARKRYDRRRDRNRNAVERLVRRIKGYRRVATRYDKKAANAAGFVWLADFPGDLP